MGVRVMTFSQLGKQWGEALSSPCLPNERWSRLCCVPSSPSLQSVLVCVLTEDKAILPKRRGFIWGLGNRIIFRGR